MSERTDEIMQELGYEIRVKPVTTRKEINMETQKQEPVEYGWDDDMMKEIRRCMEALRMLYYERSQLYGAIISSMLHSGETEFTLSMDELKEIGLNYYLLFQKDNTNENTVVITLKQQRKHDGK